MINNLNKDLINSFILHRYYIHLIISYWLINIVGLTLSTQIIKIRFSILAFDYDNHVIVFERNKLCLLAPALAATSKAAEYSSSSLEMNYHTAPPFWIFEHILCSLFIGIWILRYWSFIFIISVTVSLKLGFSTRVFSAFEKRYFQKDCSGL